MFVILQCFRPSQPGLVFEGYNPDASLVSGSIDLVLQADCGTSECKTGIRWELTEVYANGTQEEISPHPPEIEGL